jgi:concanavalin A-like lectin/glucanase superfamily protein/VanZ like protein
MLHMSRQVPNSSTLVSRTHRPAGRIAVRLPVIVMILAATAIPVELRPHGHNALGYGFQVADIAANVAGYVPVGMVLGGLGVARAVIAATLMSTLAETSQFFMIFRDSSVVDLASNIVGAILGIVISSGLRIRVPAFRVTRARALAAAALAVVLILGVWVTSGAALNPRGATIPGTLEAYWKLDESRGRAALDASGHGLDGKFSNEPKRTPGVIGGAVLFDGATDYIYVNHSTAFRLVGSMTISAWIYSTSYPRDDAAIVSTLQDIFGFQLDTTIDTGPRTVGFKINDLCASTTARYGATPLLANTWYHVAGVYDAEAQTMNVYLNGELDNGVLLGSVSGAQRSSRQALHVGTRSDRRGYDFAGAIDDVRIYSRPLTQREIVADMRGTAADDLAAGRATGTGRGSEPGAPRRSTPGECNWASDFEDRKLPGAVSALGMFVAVAAVGLWPSVPPLLWLIISPVAGLFLLHLSTPTLPALNLWTFPLTAFAGAASVVVSLRRESD